MSKSRDAFRTISEVSDALDTPAHVLRFWESKFNQVKPVKRAGGRRYYRPADLELLAGIKKLLHDDGMTIKGVQKLLREQGLKHVTAIGAETLSTADEAETVDLEIVPEQVPEPADPVQDTSVPDAQESEPTAEPTTEVEVEVEVDITNVVTLPAAEAQKPKENGPALSLNLSPQPEPRSEKSLKPDPEAAPPALERKDATQLDLSAALTDFDDVPPTAQEMVEEVDAENITPAPEIAARTPDIPADPTDSDSKAPARLFHLLRHASHDGLAANAETIAPLLDRMQVLRDRIHLR